MRECKLPLRTVLQNFINNVESLEAKKENKEEVYEQEFQELKKLTESLKTHPDYACTEGEKEYNKRKNRYKDILPYDRTRVVLQAFPGVPGSDYINANYIRGASGSRAYIASQGPLPNTVPDFWRMVVECDVQVIIMASNETEGGKHKCECYWVESEGEEKQFGNVVVSFIKSRQVFPDFLVRTLKIKFTTENNKTEERTICQFHYMLWPDHGVPDTVRPLLHMVRLVRDCQASETLPVLVHCSAGCGRTGTICAIDYVWGLLRTGKLNENLHLLGLVREMRVQRVAMVQTKEQYTLLHQAVKELFRDRLSLIDSHPYENVSTDGNPLVLQSPENKESDYEELLLSQEKQDRSTKSIPSSAPPLPPSSSAPPPLSGTPSGSLNRKASQLPNQRLLSGKDTLRRSASTSSLDTHRVCPAIPNDSTLHLPFTSASLDASTCRQKDVHTKLPSFQSESTLHRPKHQTGPSVADENSPSKKPPRVYSKVEKEAENLAQRMETREREMRKHTSSSSLHQKSSSMVSSSSPTIATHPDSPTVTPNPTSLTGSGTLTAPPVPPPRSRTPSPVITTRKISSEHQKKSSAGTSTRDLSGEKRKSTEIVRRPSIQKLRELFEKSSPSSSVIECPNGARLCRSASSVTTRSGLLSLQSDILVPVSSLKVKRKGSLGSEQSLVQGSRATFPVTVKDTEPLTLQICPPPPPISSQGISCGDGKESAFTPVVGGKPPSSPVLGNILGVKRKVTQIPYDESKEEKHLVHLTRLDDRPALPIKKSKSFRWSRTQGSSGSTVPSERSPEIPRKRTDLNTYFSLDRGKENAPSVRGVKGENSIKKIANDFFPLHQEGLKLSVYEACMNAKPSLNAHSSPSEDKLGVGAKIDSGRPMIPPKKTAGGDKHLKNAKLLSLQIPLSRSTVQVNDQSSLASLSDHSNSKEAQTPLSAPPNASLSFENKDFWERMRETCFENLYDELPSRSRPVHKSEQPPPEYHASAHPKSSHQPPIHPVPSAQNPTLQGSKDYVNARVLSGYFGSEDCPRVSFVPLPSKRESKEKGAHDYANCSVFALHEEKCNRNEDVSSSQAGGTPRLNDDVPTEKLKVASEGAKTKDSLTTHSSDYEPVDFGETLTNVDEVFETLNYELIESKSKEKKNKEKAGSSRLDYYLNKDLDSLAIQVYQDCQAYLLNGNSRSPVPSLMPKSSGKVDTTNSNSGKIAGSVAEAVAGGSSVTDLEEVRNKVSVPPQGLRNRERRNSYRQAVNTVATSYGRGGGLERQLDPMKKVHKYEKIWFETMKEEMDEEGPSGQRDGAEQATLSGPGQDFSSNFNHPMNISGKEALFKDKLEELHGLVSNMEKKKLPDLSEEELSSRDSGSTSSLFSRSAQSSRSSERVDPIYVNVPLAPGATRPSSSPVETSLGKIQQPSLVKGSSPYGTLATTTSYPYKPRVAPPQQKLGPNGLSSPFKTPPGAATLPARSTASPPPSTFPQIQNIPPPLGFGNPVFQASNPSSPVDSSRPGMENPHEKKPLFPPIFRNQPPKGGGNFGNFSAGASHSDSERSKQKKHHYPKTSAATKLTSAFYKGKTHHHDVATSSDALAARKEKGGSYPLDSQKVKRISGSASDSHVTSQHPKIFKSQMNLCCSSSRCKKDKSNIAAGRQEPPAGLTSSPSLHQEGISSSPNPSLNPSVYYHAPMVHSKPLSVPSESIGGPNGSVKGNFANSQGLVPPETSSTDTEDEPALQKTSASNLLRKLKGTNGRAYTRVGPTGKNDEGGDSFFPKEDKDKGARRGPISPPGSPRAFSKAFGKLKLGSKSVAANFKSYLSSRGSSESPSDGISSEVATRHYPLQKSVSSGPSVSIFSQVVENSKPPSPLPKKANRELLPHSFRCYDHTSKAEPKASRARQQYL